MDIITPGLEAGKLASSIKEEVKKIDRSRENVKRQWLVNVMFLYGQHHFALTKRSESGDILLAQRIAWEIENMRKSNTMRRTYNYILPLFRSLYSRLLRMKANVHAEPTTSTERDRNASRVSKEVAEDFWKNCNRNNPWLSEKFSGMDAVLQKLILHELAIGRGHLIPYFNPKSQTYVYDPVRQDTVLAEVGEAEVRFSSAMDTFRDPFGRHIIVRRFISVDQVEYEFDQEVKPDKVDPDTLEDKIAKLLEGDTGEKDQLEGVYVYDKYCIPSKKYPDGQLLSCAGDRVLYDGPLPKEYNKQNPVVEFNYQDLGFSQFPQGAIQQVVDLQQDLNETITRIGHIKKNLTGKVLAPRGSKLSSKWDDEVGQIMFYAQGSKPEYLNAVNIPQSFYEEIQRITNGMENLMNSHDSSMGRTPGQVKSGIGISNLSEIDNSQISPELIQFEQRLGYFTETVLNIAQEKYQERRILNITGDDMAYEIKSFIGSDLFGQKRIIVKMGSNLPLNTQERQQYIIMLRDKGFISSDRAKELLEFGDIDGIYTGLDETVAKNDIMNVIEGNAQVMAQPWEDHTVVLKVINDFRKGSIYSKLDPMKRQAIDMLAQQHQDMLLNEQNAASSMGQGLPPAAMPQDKAG